MGYPRTFDITYEIDCTWVITQDVDQTIEIIILELWLSEIYLR
jgi:hypothetical protein